MSDMAGDCINCEYYLYDQRNSFWYCLLELCIDEEEELFEEFWKGGDP